MQRMQRACLAATRPPHSTLVRAARAGARAWLARLPPGAADTLAAAACLQHAAGDFAAARDGFEAAADAAGPRPDLLYNAAVCRFRLGALDAAAQLAAGARHARAAAPRARVRCADPRAVCRCSRGTSCAGACAWRQHATTAGRCGGCVRGRAGRRPRRLGGGAEPARGRRARPRPPGSRAGRAGRCARVRGRGRPRPGALPAPRLSTSAPGALQLWPAAQSSTGRQRQHMRPCAPRWPLPPRRPEAALPQVTEHNRAVAAAGSDPEAAAAALGRLLAARPGAGPAARGAPAPALRNLLLVLLGAGAPERAGALLAEHRALAGTNSLPHVGALCSTAGCMISSYRGSAFVACFVRNETPLQLPRSMHVLPHWQECAADAPPASPAHLPALPRRVFAGAEAAHKRAACA